ncbi:MAG: C2H2-type zinc finger protein [Bacilli bacterium]|nr:C2H2-type zinc finger protein [Bacilli bacterium]
MYICKLCNKEFKNLNVLSAHLTKKHKNISQKYYYDTYIDTNSYHICPTCGKPTKFQSIGYGYKTHCNKICANKDTNVIKQRHETLSNTFGHPFNRPEVLEKCKQTLKQHYNVENPYLIPQIKENAHSKEALQKHYNTLKKNKTFKVSEQENIAYKELCDFYGNSNVKRNYKTLEYPFRCDFYIIPLNLYIECNFHWTHGHIKYDGRKTFCKQQLTKWKEKAKTSKYYQNAINVWTNRDIKKYKCARKNKLNYIVFWKLQDLYDFLNN